MAELSPIFEGKPDVTRIERIDLERLAREFRTQHIIFETSRRVRPGGHCARWIWPVAGGRGEDPGEIRKL